MAKDSGIVRELIISFGFLNGVWLAIGINPQTEIVSFFQQYLESLSPVMKTVFIVIPIVLLLGTIFTVLKVYHHGGFFGALAVFVAFAAGYLVLKTPQLTAPMLIAAYIIGWLAFRK